MPAFSDLRPSPVRGASPLLRGLSWQSVGLLGIFVALWTLPTILQPRSGVAGTGLAGFLEAWFANIGVSLVGGVVVLVTALAVLNLAGEAAITRRGLVVLAGLLAAVAGAVASYLTRAVPFAAQGSTPWLMLATWLDWALLLAAGYLFLLRERAARASAEESALRLQALEKERAEARLRLLQAQIEPHFLFNTLSNIRRLCQSDLTSGRAMLTQLSRYLQAALPRIRRDQVSLGEEIEMLSAYLALQKIRMGERLGVSIDIPEAHRGAMVPSMMLATLVENALKHGLAPLVDGGWIRLQSLRSGDQLVVRVADTGQGLQAAGGSGVGLANIRARLAALYGTRASLTLEANAPRGLVAAIALPWSEGRAA